MQQPARELSLLQQVVLAAALVLTGIWQWMGTLRLANLWLDYICRCSWPLLERVQLSLAGSYSGNLVADFSAGNGGAVDAVVKANVGSGGKVTKYRLCYFVWFAWIYWCGWGLLWNFLRAIRRSVSKAEIVTENHI
jgi:hypothetical protein